MPSFPTLVPKVRTLGHHDSHSVTRMLEASFDPHSFIDYYMEERRNPISDVICAMPLQRPI